MEIVAHGLWAAAGAVVVNRRTPRRLSIPWTVWWAVFPDVLAFGPPAAVGLWLKLSGRLDTASAHDGHLHVHLGLPLYPAGHSLLISLLVFGIAAVLMRRTPWVMLGWVLHILIDIPTHSLSYYATRFLWPVSDFRIDGIAWWTRWFWLATYAALAAAYLYLWRKGWLSRATRARTRSRPAA
jgi:hypothetical protein